MTTFLIASDFSSRAEQALRMGVLLARQSGATLKLVYAIDADQPASLLDAQRQQAELMLQRQATTIEQSDSVTCHYGVAIAAGIDEAVLSAADADTALIILGRHRERPLRDLFLSSTSERIIAHASCPVLVVQTPPLEPHTRLLVATDTSQADLAATAVIASHPITAQLPTTLLHVVGSLEDSPAAANRVAADSQALLDARQAASAQRALDTFVQQSSLSAVNIRVEVNPGPTANTILDVATREGADLVAVRRRSTDHAIEALLRPSVCTRLLNSAAVDLLIL